MAGADQDSYPQIPIDFPRLNKLQSLLPIYPPPEPLQRPNLPARQLSPSSPYTCSTHIIPACYVRVARPVSFPPLPPLYATKEERKAALSRNYDILIKARGDPDRETDGYPQVVWNSVNRYVCKTKGKGTGNTLILAHANGFPKEIWEPMLDRLLTSEAASLVDEVWSWEAFQHGDSALLNSGTVSALSEWRDNSRDTVNFLANFLPNNPTEENLPTHLPRIPLQESKDRLTNGIQDRRIIVIGHSYGGATMALAACWYPALFTSLILVDPVIVAPYETAQKAKATGLAMGALNRREEWASREEAEKAFLKNPFFTAWDPDVLRIYIDHGLYITPTGTARLKMSGLIECSIFSDVYTSGEIFQRLSELDDRIPIRWIMPAKPDTVGGPGDAARRVWLRPRNSSNIRIRGAGHLIPQEAPKQLAEDLAKYLLQSVGTSPSYTKSSL